MRISEAAKSEGGNVGSMRAGALAQKFLLEGQDDSPNNYLLNVGLTGSGGWGTPRHRHNFDQIRYVLNGEYPVSPHKKMKQGSVAYFPESVHYGPQDRPEGLEMMVIQFGGASGSGFLSVAGREAANKRLEQKGKFENGVFTWVDEKGQKHNQDGSAACFEEATGQKLVFHKPRYDDVIMFEPEAYAWTETGQKGVQTRHLGTFTERDTRIGFLKIEKGASFDTGTRDQIQVLFLSEGAISVDGESYGPKTAIELTPGDTPTQIRAEEDALFLSVHLPKF
ncbi:hypothetical protein FHS00_002675 [Limimaricola variabilis]|uniref:Cupin domain-containing protein n=1 Tax=Limimaricola variabilis TaxID=1492771 RepID=A0ABR6HR89_9RHOB|nr:hypothetical protein [Limimaricola variabilis]MBB3713074.1 hypothetical protein [Limimaricola variabilis]